MRILLADDSPVNVLVARRTLARWGGACDTAADGREALALWERGAYDLVLMDGQM
ncbi:MAG TPA: response regulator, partial [Planctomycetota bacterium]|nr:response regulator [Planctomycetota bacterium]